MRKKEKATLRKELDRLGFDWKSGRILVQEVFENMFHAWSDSEGARWVDFDDPILDLEFGGFGDEVQCPRFVAEDKEAIYFPAQYDGDTWVEKVYKDIGRYLDWKNYESPYPGA
ncbi:MAG: hypothetical protein DRP95_00130 [Candidatus Latescibacterota bacterium]|nr:MAG: hypothetical protein DRP95_00130 [Candidatus Latescibacterota bacterium]